MGYWILFGAFAALTILVLLLGLVNEKFSGLVGLPSMHAGNDAGNAEIFITYLFSIINLFLGLTLAWLAPDDRTARWLALGMVGTAAAFNLSAHHVFDTVAGSNPAFAKPLHIGFHLAVASGYAYALMLFPDGELPPIPGWIWSVVVAVALVGMVYAYALYDSSEGWVILYFGVVVVVAGGLALLCKAHFGATASDRERAAGYFGAYVTGAAVTVAFAALMLAIQLHRSKPPDGLFGEKFAENVVVSLAPILAAIPIVLLIGLIRDRLWGIDDVVNRSSLFGGLVALVLLIFTVIDLVVDRLASKRFGDSFLISLSLLALTALALERPRERIVHACRRLVYGIDSDPDLAVRDLSERLASSVSGEDVVPALADVTRRSIGVSAGELAIRLPSGEIISRTWPDGVRNSSMQRIKLRSHDEGLGEIAVRKVTRRPLSRKERELVETLATTAALAFRARTAVSR